MVEDFAYRHRRVAADVVNLASAGILGESVNKAGYRLETGAGAIPAWARSAALARLARIRDALKLRAFSRRLTKP